MNVWLTVRKLAQAKEDHSFNNRVSSDGFRERSRSAHRNHSCLDDQAAEHPDASKGVDSEVVEGCARGETLL